MNSFLESTGFSNLREFANNNEKMTAVAGVGLLLEWIDETSSKSSEDSQINA